MQSAYAEDAEFHREFLKLVGDEFEPLLPEELTQIIRDTPRDAEVTQLLKTISGHPIAAALTTVAGSATSQSSYEYLHHGPGIQYKCAATWLSSLKRRIK